MSSILFFRNIVLNSLCKKTRKELEAKIKAFANAMHPYAQVIYEYSSNPSLGIVNAFLESNDWFHSSIGLQNYLLQKNHIVL